MPEMKKGRIAALLTKKTAQQWQKVAEKRRPQPKTHHFSASGVAFLHHAKPRQHGCLLI